ncbi:hypothetical protein ES703_19404 [subsurface metagenome]
MLGISGGDALLPRIGIVATLGGGEAPGPWRPGDGDIAVGVGGLAEGSTRSILTGDCCS